MSIKTGFSNNNADCLKLPNGTSINTVNDVWSYVENLIGDISFDDIVNVHGKIVDLFDASIKEFYFEDMERDIKAPLILNCIVGDKVCNVALIKGYQNNALDYSIYVDDKLVIMINDKESISTEDVLKIYIKILETQLIQRSCITGNPEYPISFDLVYGISVLNTVKGSWRKELGFK